MKPCASDSVPADQLNVIAGINQYVDVHHMIQKCSIYRPNKRTLEANENVTLPLGTERSELRWFFYMSHDKNSTKDLFTRKVLHDITGRDASFCTSFLPRR